VARRTVRSKHRKRPRFRFRLPPWAPIIGVVAVTAVLIGGFLAFARETAAKPGIGDHIHAAMNIYVCGQPQPVLPAFEAGIHSHGDGLMHMHPQSSSEEGLGAAVGKFFQYGHWELNGSTLSLPGGRVFKDGDLCPDGRPGVLRMMKYRLQWRSDSGDHAVLSNQCSRFADADMEEVEDFPNYVPSDGDCLHLNRAGGRTLRLRDAHAHRHAEPNGGTGGVVGRVPPVQTQC
jgi:hypothetical protein